VRPPGNELSLLKMVIRSEGRKRKPKVSYGGEKRDDGLLKAVSRIVSEPDRKQRWLKFLEWGNLRRKKKGPRKCTRGKALRKDVLSNELRAQLEVYLEKCGVPGLNPPRYEKGRQTAQRE